MHEVFFHEGLGFILGGGFFRCEEAEGDEFLFHFCDDLLLVIRDEDAGAEDGIGEMEDTEDGLVDFALARREFPGHGDGACHVGIPTGVFCADIEEDEVAVIQYMVVGDVMEDAGVFAAGDDGCVCEAA